MANCPQCDGSGFKPVKRGTVTRCDCRQRSIAAVMDRVATEPAGADAADVLAFVEALRGGARGAKRAIRARKLAPLVFGREHVAGADRKLRALAHGATALGHPIASGNSGYFYATTPDELDEVIGRLRSQAMRELERVRKLESLRDQLSRAMNGNVFDESRAS